MLAAIPLIKRNSSSSHCFCADFGLAFFGSFVDFGVFVVSFGDNRLTSSLLSSAISSKSSSSFFPLVGGGGV